MTKAQDKLRVEFVKNGTLIYPKGQDDYDQLKRLKLPTEKIAEDFFPLLQRAQRLHGLNFIVTPFEELEALFTELMISKWPFELEVTKTSIVLKAPKSIKDEKLDKFLGNVKRWYLKHHVSLDVVMKRSAKSVKVILNKRLKD